MRKFTSYGSPNPKSDYYAPREKLLDKAYNQLLGDNPDESGHYITVWAPRQTGKSWAMLEVMKRIRRKDDFHVAMITMQSAKEVKTDAELLGMLAEDMSYYFEVAMPKPKAWNELNHLFTREFFTKPVILILDEFDAMGEEFINKFANEFRKIYTARMNESEKGTGEKKYLLHGLALIGVRSVLGIENQSGSPFNVQRSLHVENLSKDDVKGMFEWYERESGQRIEPEVVERLYYETRGQPGLIGWFGELMTDTFNENPRESITPEKFERVWRKACNVLPNNNILNILSKVKPQPYRDIALELFKTEEKIEFKFEVPELSWLYMNGVIDAQSDEYGEYVRFASPFVQKKIFDRFSNEIFDYTGKLFEPFEDLSAILTDDGLNVKNLMGRYQGWMKENREWLLADAPRRKDMRIYEAVYHFNLYRYLYDFLKRKRGRVFPEFPTGNGKIDLIVKYQGKTYGIEVKSYTDETGYRESLKQAAEYGAQMKFFEIWLVLFVEYVDDENRRKYEKDYIDEETGVKVGPVFVETGN